MIQGKMIWALAITAAFTTLIPAAHAQKQKSIFQVVPTPNSSSLNNELRAASASSANDVWSVGYTTIHFDGKKWKDFPAPGADASLSEYLTGVFAVSPTLAWAGGGHDQDGQIIDKWNGKKWVRVQGLPFQPDWLPQVEAMTGTGANDIWAMGSVQPPGDFCLFFEHWDGHSWTADPNGLCAAGAVAGISGASQDATNDIWAAGVQLVDFDEWPLAIQFDGSNATVQNLPFPQGEQNAGLQGIVALAPNNVWAVGWQNPNSDPVDYTNLTLIYHFDGNSWTIVPSPNRKEQGSTLEGVVANSPDDIYAVGYSRVLQGNMYTLVLQWDGKQWKIIPSPNPEHDPPNTIDVLWAGVVPSPGNVWLFGNQFTAPHYQCCEATLTLHTTSGN